MSENFLWISMMIVMLALLVLMLVLMFKMIKGMEKSRDELLMSPMVGVAFHPNNIRELGAELGQVGPNKKMVHMPIIVFFLVVAVFAVIFILQPTEFPGFIVGFLAVMGLIVLFTTVLNKRMGLTFYENGLVHCVGFSKKVLFYGELVMLIPSFQGEHRSTNQGKPRIDAVNYQAVYRDGRNITLRCANFEGMSQIHQYFPPVSNPHVSEIKYYHSPF